MNARLEGWKTKYLSLAGRHVLAQSVLSVIPLYPMQTFILLNGLCAKMEKIIRNFIWGGRPRESKMSLVAWDEVTRKKDCGGLGIRSLHEMFSVSC